MAASQIILEEKCAPENIPMWKLARQGIQLIINNKASEADALFKKYPDSNQMWAGYSFAVFMDALMTFEEDKLNIAFSTLKETERRSISNNSWLKSVKSKMFGSDTCLSTAEQLENQIILADTQVCVAILTFLQQDLSGYFKGGWVLRKSWKVYQHAYHEVKNLYKEIIGELPELATPRGASRQHIDEDDTNSVTENEWEFPDEPPSFSYSSPSNGYIQNTATQMTHSYTTSFDPKHFYTNAQINSNFKCNCKCSHSVSNNNLRNNINQCNSKCNTATVNFAHGSQNNCRCESQNCRVAKESYSTVASPDLDSSSTFSNDNSENSSSDNKGPYSNFGKVNSFLKKSTSVNSALSKRFEKNRQSNGFLSQLSPFNSNLSLSYLSSTFNIFSSEKPKSIDIDRETVIRLMGAVSFGYGLFHLGISLLPPSLLKITNFLGFGGNRQLGIANLMYAREGTDMRAPLATLALLWYHTIVRPFYAIDGSNVQAGVEAATQLLEESQKEYSDSALFLFFKGRVCRLNSDISSALKAFQASVDNSTQREIKILSLHEVGWCHLIKLDFQGAENTFHTLKQSSRWSRSFYGYLETICSGSCNNINDFSNLKELKLLCENGSKGNQLELFLCRRYKCFQSEDETEQKDPVFWRLFVYELLYLWNTLPSCNTQGIKNIIEDCKLIEGHVENEPMPGLAKLIQGCCYCILKQFETGIYNFRECLEIRKDVPHNADDAHVSAFSQYELGLLLFKNPETKEEGKTLLSQTSLYKDYDFEQRLTVRIHTILKNE